jgi:hypothetical protein
VVAVEQLHSELALKLRDTLGDGRLGGVEALCRAAKAAELHNPEERLDRSEIQCCLSPSDQSDLSIPIKKED